ncbi:hypothetical protein Y032_0708g1710 [Ancylostoma ceylanicum]|uniref:Uncharacterized protein n=1 Tax=Ancylostoma ceylanicum TaxID=53326 RepID=A0A016WG40_9BILA|nr:hypothetical protein Y032_0708g1710 [Ancylostoma ceylanicum]
MELHPLFSFEKRKRKAERDKSEPKKKSIKSVINEMARKIDNLEKDMAKLVSQPRYGEDVPPLHLEKVVQRPATPPPGPSGSTVCSVSNASAATTAKGANKIVSNFVKAVSNLPTHTCNFCGGPHWATECKQYGTLLARRKRVQATNKCERCLGKADHLATSCPTPAHCFYCKTAGRMMFISTTRRFVHLNSHYRPLQVSK